MDALVESSDRPRTSVSWVRHGGGALLGLVFVLALEGVTRFERGLRTLQLRDIVAWPSWLIAGRFLLLVRRCY